MLKNLLAFCGLLGLLGGLGIWQFGFLSGKVEQMTEQVKRETAVARAEATLRDWERKAEELTENARKLRIDARAREIAAERETESLSKTKGAIEALATAAKQAGLPKPSAATPDTLKQTLAFAGRKLEAADVYKTLERWQGQVRTADQKHRTTQASINRLREVADQLESKQETLLAKVTDVRGKLEELEMQRDLVRLDKKLAELGATASGNHAGELGKLMKTIQDEIDESLATIEVLNVEVKNNAPLTPDEALDAAKGGGMAAKELDKLWE